MLFAKNIKTDSLEIYISFLSDIIKTDNASYKEIFSTIIETTHKVANGEINFSSVPSEIFDLVSILSLNHREYFSKINPKDLKKAEFEVIKQFLEKDLFEIA